MNISVIPNILTGFRFMVVPFLLFCLQPGTETKVALFGFSLFALAGISDFFDGYLARRWKAQSPFGKLMDPLADKILVTVALIMLIPMGRISAVVVFLILARELVITGLRGVAAASGLVISASKMGKWKTFIQILALGTLMFPLGIIPIDHLHEIGQIILYIALALTLLSGAEYVLKFYKLYSQDSAT